MVASDKIEQAKWNCFRDLKESGRNNFQKYNYSELKDIVPLVNKVCEKYKLKRKFEWDVERNVMTLTFTDCEDGSTDVSTFPLSVLGGGDPGKQMQDLGRIQTYARRYLYLQVFDIAVPDEIDSRDQRAKPKQVGSKKVVKPKPKQKPQPQPKQVQKQEEEEPTSQMTEEVKKVMDEAYTIITEEQGKPFHLGTALWTIKDLCDGNQELYKACKEAMKTYTAEEKKNETIQ